MGGLDFRRVLQWVKEINTDFFSSVGVLILVFFFPKERKLFYLESANVTQLKMVWHVRQCLSE